MTILLTKDRYSRAIQAWVVGREGPGLDAAGVATSLDGTSLDSDIVGHRGCVPIKTDNELACHSRRCEALRAVENRVNLLKGLLRVHLLALERKFDGNIPSQHPCMTWLVRVCDGHCDRAPGRRR